MERDPASNQLKNYKNAHQSPEQVTTASGKPYENASRAALTAGARGPVLMQDLELVDELAHFARERIPERPVHAKGAGAFGYFEVTHDITKYCKAKIFEKIGKQTPMAIRYSTAVGSLGSADTVRDVHGFALKFYTEEGNFDIAGFDAPIFFLRDPMLFVSFLHVLKKNPETNLIDYDKFWDFMSLRPETIHHLTMMYSDRGIPYGYRHMDGFGVHAFKMVNAKNEAVYAKFHFKTDQGTKNFTTEEAAIVQSEDLDWFNRDLYNAIARGNYPTWTAYIQVMTMDQAEKYVNNPFDLTKVWPHKEYPLIQFGKYTLNRNPSNYFAQVEQIAMSPSNLVPGIEPSPDRIFHARLFAYNDTQRHRLGANFYMIPVNCPFHAKARSNMRDGPMCVDDNKGGAPNYSPNSFNGLFDDATGTGTRHKLSGTVDVARYEVGNEDNFTQCGVFYRKVLSEKEKESLVNNIAKDLVKAQDFIQERQIENFSKADQNYGTRVRAAINQIKMNNGIKPCMDMAKL